MSLARVVPFLVPAWTPSSRTRAGAIPLRRLQAGGLALLMLFTVVASLPVHTWLTASKYKLNAETLALVGSARPELAKKLVLDPQTATYQFNPEAKKEDPSSSNDPNVVAQLLAKRQQQKTVVGDSKDAGLYSLDLPVDASKGMTFTDNNANISFKMTPMFDKGAGRKTQDRLVYPLSDGIKAVYTVKNNGLKEDIVYEAAPESGSASYSYKLELPDSLEARLMDDGGMGIYSADPSLFGDISFGSDEDRVKVESARQSAPKDHLVFGLPKPVIVAKDNKLGNSSAWFTLGNNVLTVNAKDLNTIQGPFSIDPSVVITSSSDFATGNNEGGIEFGIDEIKRASLSGGTVRTWATETTLLPRSRSLSAAVAYNGFIYVLGGRDEETSTDLDSVTYAPVNSSTGALGTWVDSPNVFANARYYHGGAVYNGYLYIMGGRNFAGTTFTDVQYAKINADGSPGVWSATSSYAGTARRALKGLAHAGHLYISGGFDGTTYYDNVQYAPIRTDGTVGAWASATAMPSGRYAHAFESYNGYLYVNGGVIAGGGTTATAYFAKIADNGTLGSWRTATSIPNARYQHNMVFARGYAYVVGGTATVATPTTQYLDTQYAEVYTDGSLGPWIRSVDYDTTDQTSASFATLNGYMYSISGRGASLFRKYVRSTKIEPVGYTSPFAATTAIPTIGNGPSAIQGAREGHAMAVANGYIYSVGGQNNSGTPIAQVVYAPINADGTIGTWTATTALPATSAFHTAFIDNGYLYVTGGFTGSASLNTIRSAPLSTTGTVGTWATATPTFTNARSRHTSVIANGYLYVIGGWNGSTRYADTQAALLCNGSNSGVGGCSFTAGSVGTWVTSTPTFTDSRWGHSSIFSNGYVYVMGGTGAARTANVQYALVCTGSNTGVGGCTATAGTVGTWTTTTALPSARASHISVTSKGYIYTLGGITTAAVNDVLLAKVNTDGTLGPWSSLSGFATARYGLAGAQNGGSLYISGGYSGSAALADVQLTKMNNGGSGDVVGWNSSTSFATGRYDSASAAANGYIYVFGGAFSDSGVPTQYLADVQMAQINADGSLGAWAVTTSLPQARQYHSAVIHNGFAYVIGGLINSSTAPTDKIAYAPINQSTGAIGAWSTTGGSNVYTSRQKHTSEVYNNTLYLIAGDDYGGTRMPYTDYATINADGTLGAWSTAVDLPSARSEHASALHNGFLYVLGGFTPGGDASNAVFVAKINADKTLGTWVTTRSFDRLRYSLMATAYNGNLYMVGGFVGGGVGAVSDTQFAAINNDGTIGRWNYGKALATPREESATAFYENTMYLTGGSGGGTAPYTNAQYTTFESIHRKATYSKLIDVGSVSSVSNIGYTGTLPGGKASISFKYAGTDGILSTTTPATALGGTCGTSVTARYLLVTLNFNDSTTAAYSDLDGPIASVQDITVDTIVGGAGNPVDPAKRLRGGKFFDTVTGLQPLDTLKLTAPGGGGC